MKELARWILRPFVRLVLNNGNETIPQSIGLVTGHAFDKELEAPALFAVADTVTGNVNVEYVNGTSEIIECQFLSSRNMLVKQINSSDTDLTIDQIRLEV